MEPLPIIIVGGVVFFYAILARAMAKTMLSGPMYFAAAGFAIGPWGFAIVDVSLDSPAVHLLIEGALVLVLFTDASRVRFSQLRQGFMLPGRLLAVGLPLTMVVGAAAAAVFFPGMSWLELVLLAVMLAPTDAALGQAVVSSEWVPIKIRQTLNVESGLNDGIAVPVFTGVLLVAGVAAHAAEDAGGGGGVLSFGAAQLILGPVAGVLVAWPAGWLVERSAMLRTSTSTTIQIAGVAIAVSAFAVASFVGGNGFIAAFVAGLVIGNTTKTTCHALVEFAEDEGQLLALIAFLVFGAVMLPAALDALTPPVVWYAIVSLTVVRLLPVFVSTLGSGLRLPSILFLGWFGPRGLATVLFALLIHDAHGVSGRGQLFAIASFVVVVSVVAHGLSAAPLSRWYGRWADRLRVSNPDASECMPAPALPTRFRVHARDSAAREGPA